MCSLDDSRVALQSDDRVHLHLQRTLLPYMLLIHLFARWHLFLSRVFFSSAFHESDIQLFPPFKVIKNNIRKFNFWRWICWQLHLKLNSYGIFFNKTVKFNYIFTLVIHNLLIKYDIIFNKTVKFDWLHIYVYYSQYIIC